MSGFTKGQKNWFKRVYDNSCHFPLYSEHKGFYYCLSDYNIHVHHITPQRYSEVILRTNPNNMRNGIIICERHHVGKGYTGSLNIEDIVDILHPDMGWAFRNYSKYKSGAFDKVFSARDARLAKDLEYWLSDYDNFLKETVDYKVNNYLRNNPEDQFP